MINSYISPGRRFIYRHTGRAFLQENHRWHFSICVKGWRSLASQVALAQQRCHPGWCGKVLWGAVAVLENHADRNTCTEQRWAVCVCAQGYVRNQHTMWRVRLLLGVCIHGRTCLRARMCLQRTRRARLSDSDTSAWYPCLRCVCAFSTWIKPNMHVLSSFHTELRVSWTLWFLRSSYNLPSTDCATQTSNASLIYAIHFSVFCFWSFSI